jgi:hypothetical protein
MNTPATQTGCNKVATIAVTILAGPLNYVGVNPKLSCHTRIRVSNPAPARSALHATRHPVIRLASSGRRYLALRHRQPLHDPVSGDVPASEG